MVSSLDSIPSEYQWPLSWHFFSRSWWSKTNHLVVYIRFHYKKKKRGKKKNKRISCCAIHCIQHGQLIAIEGQQSMLPLCLVCEETTLDALDFEFHIFFSCSIRTFPFLHWNRLHFLLFFCYLWLFLVEDENRTLPLNFCFTRHLPFLLDFLDQSSSEPASS